MNSSHRHTQVIGNVVQQQQTNDPTAKPAQVMPELRNCHARLVLSDTVHQQCSYCPTVKPTRKTAAQSCCIPVLSPPHSKTSKGQTATCLLQSSVLYTSNTPTAPQQNQQGTNSHMSAAEQYAIHLQYSNCPTTKPARDKQPHVCCRVVCCTPPIFPLPHSKTSKRDAKPSTSPMSGVQQCHTSTMIPLPCGYTGLQDRHTAD